MVNSTLLNVTNALANVNNSLVTDTKTAFLNNYIGPVLVLFVLPVILAVVILIFVVRNVTPIMHFLYADARIHARSNYTVSGSLLLELTGAKSLKEFRSLLRDTIYGEHLEKIEDNLRSVHVSLEKGYTDSIYELIEMSPQKSKPLLDSYLMFLEVKMLKIIYRAKFNKVEIDESFVYPIGNIDRNLLKHLLDAETVADISVVMTNTTYSKVFEKKYPALEEFEVAVDEFVFNNFVDTIKKTKIYDGNCIIDILNKKIDIYNILALLKFRIRGMEKEKQKNLLVNNKSSLCLRFDKLINAETLKDFAEEFKGMVYYESLTKAFEKYEKDNSLAHFENELYRLFKKHVMDNELAHTLGPYPLFSYLIKRELELRNLFITSRGIDAGFSTEKIKEMIT